MPSKVELETGSSAPTRSRPLTVAGRQMGGGAPIWVESMVKTSTTDVSLALAQLESLHSLGCELVRLALPGEDELSGFQEIVASSPLPIVADVHFHYRLAVSACKTGCAGVRINPGNIGSNEQLREVVRAAKDNHCHIRVGANSGSISKEMLARFGGPTPEALVESVSLRLSLLEDMDFRDIVVSLKTPHVPVTVSANRLFRRRYDYPLHIGITESGFGRAGVVRSTVGLALLLAEGLGDSVRVSLTEPPEEEVRVGYQILQALELRQKGINLISCPTCGRCRVNLIALAKKAEKALADIASPLWVAVMGCEVNGPGEAREADVGIACGRETGLLFAQGEVVEKLPTAKLVPAMVRTVRQLVRRRVQELDVKGDSKDGSSK